MFIKVKLPWDVTIPAEDMDTNANGLMLQRAILIRLFDDFVTEKATKNLGYFVTIKNLENIGEGRINEHTGGIQIDTTIRFIVLATKWQEAEKEFLVLASIEGDNLGPI